MFSFVFLSCTNHDFTRNSTKGFIFKAFCVFSNCLHGRLKKETVNLSIKNAILCLRVVHALGARAFSLTTETRFLRGKRESGERELTA